MSQGGSFPLGVKLHKCKKVYPKCVVAQRLSLLRTVESNGSIHSSMISGSKNAFELKVLVEHVELLSDSILRLNEVLESMP